MGRKMIGSFETLILATLVGRPDGSYGIEIGDRIRAEIGREISLGALYTALERLERRGFLSSRWGEPTKERGGRRKRYFRLEGKGERALREAHAAVAGLAGPSLVGA